MAPHTSASTALVIEDDPSTIHFYRHVLRAEGFEVVVSRSGHDDVALCEQHNPTVVIADLMLPGLYGTSVIGAVKARWRQLPVIVVSSLPECTVAQDAWQARAFAYLTKPFRLEELLATVHRAVARPAPPRRIPAGTATQLLSPSAA
jgi:DNA-binding response OmpR family regulator